MKINKIFVYKGTLMITGTFMKAIQEQEKIFLMINFLNRNSLYLSSEKLKL